MKRPAEVREQWDEQIYAPDPRAETPPHGWALWLAIAVVVIVAALLWLFPPVSVAKAQEHPNCRGFIPKECCCTANYCRTIKGSEIKFDGKVWRAVASGRAVENVYPSKDGDLILCDNNGLGRAYCAFLDFGT